MDERGTIARELAEIEQDLKELMILFEKYFAGIEKREPMQQREAVAKRLRRFVNRRIIQTDLRFRYQSLASRFQSYNSHWDRILRLIDEGRYDRQVAKLNRAPVAAGTPPPGDPSDAVYRELLAARKACQAEGAAPGREQVAAFLERQREKIREKFGDREVEFRVVTEDGKPKIKVRAKK